MCTLHATIAAKPIDERFLWLMVYGQADGCPLAKQRLVWLLLQDLRGKDRCPPMPDDPEPSFWPATLRHKPSAQTGNLIERIKAAYRIEDIAEKHTHLRGSHTLSGPCFLHGGSGSEFVIWVDEQRWKCWGACGTGGDVIDLIREMKERNLEWMKS